ncbi:MAG: prepilin peptidase [Myxococcota bacterium]|nr:prepilin peptidase [Myxococcota bacterium]
MPLASPHVLALAASGFVLGLVVGSFLNVVVHRLPQGASVVRPRSRCPSCGATITARDNVPVLSFLWLGGRCRHCGTAISTRYPAVELATGVIFAGVLARHGLAPTTPLWLALAAILLASALIDFDHQIIPDELSLGGLVLGLAGMPVARHLAGVPWLEATGDAALGALLGGGFLWAAGFAHARVCAALGRTFEHWPGEGEELPRPGSLDYWTWFPGLGFGDVKLLAAIGAFVGPVGVLTVVGLSAVLGLALGLAWMAVRGRAGAPFGFGPAIAAGALLWVLFPHLGRLLQVGA